jgi:hypothetical protein
LLIPSGQQGVGKNTPNVNLQQAADGELGQIRALARASSIGGTSRPNAFAALRLMTNSNLSVRTFMAQAIDVLALFLIVTVVTRTRYK